MTAPPPGHHARRVLLGVCLLACFVPLPVKAQIVPAISSEDLRRAQQELHRETCPGDPAGNLASFDCRFTPRMRLVEFASTSVTDQAVVGAAFFGTVAYFAHRDPPEWGRGWGSAGRSMGTRYAQNLAKGGANYLVGLAMKTDPRSVALASDPCVERPIPGGPCTGRIEPATVGARIGHALLDWTTVRRSQKDAKGNRWPNIPLWSGATVSGLVGNAWLPSGQATLKSGAVTAASSLATALAASFYTEFSPEIGRALGAIVKRGRAPSPNATRTKRIP
jgi:hypothetical protein